MQSFLKNFSKIALLLLILTATDVSKAQLNGTYTVGLLGNYSNLTGAAGFFNAVNTQGLSGNVTVNIISDISEPGTVSLNQWAGTNTIRIQPLLGVSVYNLTGNTANPFINFNGADRVTIDGRFNSAGTGRFLRFSNASTTTPTFRFINDATLILIRNCIIEGENATPAGGTIEFSTTTGANGNDNNIITNCLIRDVTTGSVGTPQNAIYSNGTTSTTARNNDNITISNNEIYNFYRNNQHCTGVFLAGGNSAWTISGNSFYQSVTRTTTATTTFSIIFVNSANTRNVTITNNFFGGTAANCGGTPWTMNGNFSNSIYGIRFSNASTTVASNIQGNTISNISLTSTPSSASSVYFAGILIENGYVNIGNVTGNSIGNSTSTGSITINYNGTTSNILTRGIDHREAGDINNNTIGSISIGGTNNQVVRLECISYSGTPSVNISISNNVIGSTTISNSIQQTSNTFGGQFTGIHSALSGVTATISNNTISNLRLIATDTLTRVRGIFQARGTNAPINITNNIIAELYCSGAAINRYPDACMMIGLFSGTNSANQNIADNVIRGLYGTGNSNSYVMGFSFYNNVGKGTFERNRIYNLNHVTNTGSPKIWAINGFWGSWNFYNNQISLTNGEATDNYNPVMQENSVNTISQSSPGNNGATDNEERNWVCKEEDPTDLYQARKEDKIAITDATTNGAEIKGIHDEAEFPCVYYYNSVYIGGNATSGSAGSWAYDRPLLTWATPAILRNNIFFNARTGGTGGHYAMGNEVGAPNWTGSSANYNVYVSSSLSTIGTWGATNQTIQQWRTNSGGDRQTWSTTSATFSAANLFTNIPNCDLTIQTSNFEAWLVSGKGLAVAGQGTDYQGNTRPVAISEGCTDIGADEFIATPPSNPLATVNNPPGSGVISTYSLWGRDLAVIEWGTGGSSYPTSMQVRYYSGVNPGGVLGGGYSNSHWIITPVGSLTGAGYDITINFGDNETYNISTPSSNTRLAKFDATWEVYPSGAGPWQSELSWANFNVKTRGLVNFSTFTLTDGSNPLPVEICSFNAAVSNSRDVTLNWVTCSEINNMGFDIERRTFNAVSNEYSAWIKIGFVQGRGTTNEEQTYNFTDKRLVSGKYQYRLKQIDYNSNFEYHDLSSPSEILIGKPNIADLFQNYPNPSNPTSKVDFQIPFAGKVSLKIYDMTGKEAAVLIDGQLDAGFYTEEFNGSNLASGVYFYRLIAESREGNKFIKTMKLVLIK